MYVQVNSELETLRVGEFLAHNDEAFNKWTTTLRRACKCVFLHYNECVVFHISLCIRYIFRAGEEILRIGVAPLQSDKMTTESAIKSADLTTMEQQDSKHSPKS